MTRILFLLATCSGIVPSSVYLYLIWCVWEGTTRSRLREIHRAVIIIIPLSLPSPPLPFYLVYFQENPLMSEQSPPIPSASPHFHHPITNPTNVRPTKLICTVPHTDYSYAAPPSKIPYIQYHGSVRYYASDRKLVSHPQPPTHYHKNIKKVAKPTLDVCPLHVHIIAWQPAPPGFYSHISCNNHFHGHVSRTKDRIHDPRCILFWHSSLISSSANNRWYFWLERAVRLRNMVCLVSIGYAVKVEYIVSRMQADGNGGFWRAYWEMEDWSLCLEGGFACK